MTGTATAVPAPAPRRFNLRRALLVAAALAGAALLGWLLGWNVVGWFEHLWDTLTSVSLPYLVAGGVLQVAQILFKALAWYWILRYAYPEGGVRGLEVLACYATSCALNGFLPANLGTLVMLLMFVAVIRGATFPGILAAFVVQKIFFTLAGAAVYLYLFLSVEGSFDIKFSWLSEHAAVAIALLAAGIAGLAFVIRIAWRKLRTLWLKAKQGGAILSHPRAYFGRVFLPQFLGWSCSLGVVAVFLAAYGIPVTFETVMHVVGGNSISNMTSVTPGGVGVTQAMNVATLAGVTDSATATAYSIGQQLFTTMVNAVFALIVVTWAFGWTGGKKLVGDSYVDAKQKAAEQSEARKEKKAAKKAAKHAE